MKIVVLDGYTTNPGDLDWSELKDLGDVEIFDRTSKGEVLERCKSAEVVLTNKVVLDKEIIFQLPDLKYIGVMATGYNVVDLEAASHKNIIVTNVSGYSTDSVAQHVFAFILQIINQTGYYANKVRNGAWKDSVDFAFWDHSITELNGKVFGVVGFGTIGKRTAEIARAFGMQVLSYHTHAERDGVDWVEFVSEAALFERSDIVSLHCPLKENNRHMVNSHLLSLMKRQAILINTARGPLVNHDDLHEALVNREIYAAGLDVYDMEPPTDDHPIFSCEHAYFTPHQAWATVEARGRLLHGVIENIRQYASGTPIHVVN